MVVAKAFHSVDMGPGSSSYLPPASLSDVVAASATQIDALDPLGRLQRYFGEFNLADLAEQKYDTSTFTGYQQFAGSTDVFDDLVYELSGASVNGQVIAAFLAAGEAYALVGEIFKEADQITGSVENDILNGFTGDDVVKGSVGNDSISGNEGLDFVNGNQGDDVVGGDSAADTLHGGQGADVVTGGAGDDEVYGDDGDDFLNGNDGSDLVKGGLGNDTVRGGQGGDVVTGGGGDDDLYGDDGDDFVNGNDGGDVIRGGLGDDTLRGGQGVDLINGNEGDDQLFGDLGNDEIRGGFGNDRLTGNGGDDAIAGDLGADVFVLSKDQDLILDFNAGEGDKIEVLASTPFTLSSTGPAGSGDLLIVRDVGITTLIGVSLDGFDAATSIITIPDPVV